MERLVRKPPLISGQIVDFRQPSDLADRVTSQRELFVLAHMSVPEVDVAAWRLDVTGLVDEPRSISMSELRGFRKTTVESVLKCSGSPRMPTIPNRQVGNVEWGGVSLGELAKQLGVHQAATHLWAFGLDHGSFVDVEQPHYLKDLPRSCLEEGALIAYELNGEPLSEQHGAPARLIAPGYYGTNCVKWLFRLEFQNRRADSLFTRVFYNDRDLASDPTGHTMKPVWEVEPESIFVSPVHDEKLVGAQFEIWGWAWSNCAVQSVEVSTDGGDLWRDAELEPRHQHAWQRFRIQWNPPEDGAFELRCRATDVEGNTQPMNGARNEVHTLRVSVIS